MNLKIQDTHKLEAFDIQFDVITSQKIKNDMKCLGSSVVNLSETVNKQFKNMSQDASSPMKRKHDSGQLNDDGRSEEKKSELYDESTSPSSSSQRPKSISVITDSTEQTKQSNRKSQQPIDSPTTNHNRSMSLSPSTPTSSSAMNRTKSIFNFFRVHKMNEPSIDAVTMNNAYVHTMMTESITFQELDGDDNNLMIGSRSIAQLKTIYLTDNKYGYLTLDQFMEFGLRYAFNHVSFITIFTTIYKTFMTPKQVVPKLKASLDSLTQKQGLTQSKQEKQNRIVKRAANFIHTWVLKCQTDFMFDKNIVESLFSLIGALGSYVCPVDIKVAVDPDSSFDSTQNVVFELAEFASRIFSDLENKSKGIMNQKEFEKKAQKLPKSYLLSKEPKDPRLIRFEDIHPVEIARQLTLVEFTMFERVTNEELLGLGWMKDSKEWSAPNITEIISRSNAMADWVSTMVLQVENMKERSKLLKHFVQIADACYKLNNFNTLFEIIMALVGNPVYRLKQTWEGIGTTEKLKFKRFEEVCSFQGNRRNYREELKKVPSNQSCLPYLGVSLTDLVFFEEGNKSTKNTTEKQANPNKTPSTPTTENEQVEETTSDTSSDETVRSYINFTKRSLMAGVVSQLMDYKSRPYELRPVEYFQQFLYYSMNTNCITSEEELERISRVREAPLRKY
jgi:hypothetical protein